MICADLVLQDSLSAFLSQMLEAQVWVNYLLKKIIVFLTYECFACIPVYAPHVCPAPVNIITGHQSCEPLCGCWELNPGPL